MLWHKNKLPLAKSVSRNANEVITIGRSGPRNRSKHSRFERLDASALRDEGLQQAHGPELAIGVYHRDGRKGRDEESQESGDEIPLKGIQRRIEVEGGEERRYPGSEVDHENLKQSRVYNSWACC
jgi:hypothetical protein